MRMRSGSPVSGPPEAATGSSEVEAARGPTRILFVDDSPIDTELAQRALRNAALEFVSQCCDSKETLERSLADFRPDVIVSDYSMPGFSGLDALRLVRQVRSELPFILVSGTIGEERAIDILKGGATDYVLKDRLARLGPAIERALREVRECAERRRAEEALRASEERLRQAQKLEAIGSLAGGVAHDFNNLLTVIQGYIELASLKVTTSDPIRRDLEEVSKAAERATTLTRQLLAFSRKQVLQPTVLAVNGVVEGVQKMLGRLIGEHISFSTVLSEDAGRVRADPGQIEQVIMNLVVNARDAMPRGGRLTIETRNVVLDDEFARGRGQMSPGRYVMLAVSDTGHGIDAETQARMFEPFFTTKAPGKGTGLGLSTVYGIVAQSQGHIEVHSQPGRGTTFTIYLPNVDGESERPAVASRAAVSLRGSETVLLVEDEDLVRGVTQAMLKANGYRVLVASSGEEAIRVCTSHAGSIDLVMTDLVMPGMNGRQTVEQLERLRPGVRVLFTSGYANDEIVRHGVLVAGTEFIQKPFTAETLARKIRGVLDTEVVRD